MLSLKLLRILGLCVLEKKALDPTLVSLFITKSESYSLHFHSLQDFLLLLQTSSIFAHSFPFFCFFFYVFFNSYDLCLNKWDQFFISLCFFMFVIVWSSNLYSFHFIRVTFSCLTVLLVIERNGLFLIILSCYHVSFCNILSLIMLCALCMEFKSALGFSVKGFFFIIIKKRFIIVCLILFIGKVQLLGACGFCQTCNLGCLRISVNTFRS